MLRSYLLKKLERFHSDTKTRRIKYTLFRKSSTARIILIAFD